jgi:hypothetical protein
MSYSQFIPNNHSELFSHLLYHLELMKLKIKSSLSVTIYQNIVFSNHSHGYLTNDDDKNLISIICYSLTTFLFLFLFDRIPIFGNRTIPRITISPRTISSYFVSPRPNPRISFFTDYFPVDHFSESTVPR